MAERDEEQKFEELLDSMLATYSAAEPRPGMETRIVANLRAQGRQGNGRTWGRLWLWAGAGVAAAVASVVLVILFSRPAVPVRPAPIQANRTGAQTELPPQHFNPPESTKVRAATTRSSRRLVPGGQNIQRPDSPIHIAASWPTVFPTPVPLTPQEKLIFAYIENTPREEVIAQIVKDEQKEADAFWADREPSSGPQRSPTTR